VRVPPAPLFDLFNLLKWLKGIRATFRDIYQFIIQNITTDTDEETNGCPTLQEPSCVQPPGSFLNLDLLVSMELHCQHGC
jgi:hypothetical protein